MFNTLRHPRWLASVMVRHGMPRFRNLESFLTPAAMTALGGSTVIPKLFDATLSWDDISWIRQLWRGKLLIKGVLTVTDAERAASLGCDGIVVTNHGGRQLDSCVAPMDVLPEIVAANLPVLADASGIFGHSMGGHGALTCALKNPDRYKSVSAFAPIVAPGAVPWGKKALQRYLGDDTETWKPYDACALIRSGARFPGMILVDQGTSDKFLETQLQPERFERACHDSSQALTLRLHAGYDHSYYFISTFIEDHLRHHARALAA